MRGRRFEITAKDDGTCTVRAGVEDYYLTSTTNVFLKTVTNLVYSAEDPLLVTGTNIEENVEVETIDYDFDYNFRATAEVTFELPQNALIAIDSTADSELTLPKNLAARLNNLLPPSIAIDGIRPVTPEAHARFDALSRTYHYRITTRKNPFLVSTHARVAEGLDFDAMNAAAKLLLGRQDFSSFCRVHTDAKTMICDVSEAQWTRTDEYTAVFSITANRFLRNMVRAVVGTLFEVGKGRMTLDGFAEVIAAHDRCRAGHSAPAEGLSLVKITYPEYIYNV